MPTVSKGLLLSRSRAGETSSEHRLEFQFNPTTVSERHGVRYHFSDAQGQYLPTTQFGQKEPIELSFELFFYNHGGLDEYIKSLRLLVSPSNLSAVNFYDQIAPRQYTLNLQELGIYEGVVEDLDITIEKYDKLTLAPQRLRAHIRFKVISSGINADIQFYNRTT